MIDHERPLLSMPLASLDAHASTDHDEIPPASLYLQVPVVSDPGFGLHFDISAGEATSVLGEVDQNGIFQLRRVVLGSHPRF